MARRRTGAAKKLNFNICFPLSGPSMKGKDVFRFNDNILTWLIMVKRDFSNREKSSVLAPNVCGRHTRHSHPRRHTQAIHRRSARSRRLSEFIVIFAFCCAGNHHCHQFRLSTTQTVSLPEPKTTRNRAPDDERSHEFPSRWHDCKTIRRKGGRRQSAE